MGAIEDLSIEPTPGTTTILHGYMGVTPTLQLTGLIKFTAKKSVSITRMKITLRGTKFIQIANHAPGSAEREAKPLHAKSAEVFLLNESMVFQPDLETSNNNNNNNNIKKGKKKDRYLNVKQGEHSYPFEFFLPENVVLGLPSSVSTEMWPQEGSKLSGAKHVQPDVLRCVYSLEAEVETAPGLLSSGKVTKVIEDGEFFLVNPTVITTRSIILH
jgi:hypothetical protein